MLSVDAEKEIKDELAYKFGVTEEKAFLTGDGSSKPLGSSPPRQRDQHRPRRHGRLGDRRSPPTT
jgi:hypothetical protein